MKKDLTELKRLGDNADFFLDRTFNSLVIETCDLIMEILEEAGLKELTLMCENSECNINDTIIMTQNFEGEEDIWYQTPEDDEPFELSEEGIDFVFDIFQHVTFFVRNWDGETSDKLKFK